MCAPIIEGNTIVGLIQLYTSGVDARTYSSRDFHLFGLLTSVASLLMRQAKVAQEQAAVRAMASVGQVTAGMSHDAKNILKSFGSSVQSVETAFPALANNRAWHYVREDIEMLRFLARDVGWRISGAMRPVHRECIPVGTVVDSILARCQRYFVAEGLQHARELVNDCPTDAEAFADTAALTVALMNCVKNSLDAYGETFSSGIASVVVSSHTEGEAPEDACVISIVDDAGGIPLDVTNRLGQMLVTTKGPRGTGLGMCNVVDAVARLNGRVVLATSRQPTNFFPAGTVIALYLPQHPSSTIERSESLLIEDDYESMRLRCQPDNWKLGVRTNCSQEK